MFMQEKWSWECWNHEQGKKGSGDYITTIILLAALLLDGLAWTPSPKEKTLYGLYVIKKTKAAVSLQTQNT